jgi:hypothetical protein
MQSLRNIQQQLALLSDQTQTSDLAMRSTALFNYEWRFPEMWYPKMNVL